MSQTIVRFADECLPYHVKDVVQSTDPLTLVSVETGQTEDGWCVLGQSKYLLWFPLTDGDTGDTDPFLDDLEPNDQLDSPRNMQISIVSAE